MFRNILGCHPCLWCTVSSRDLLIPPLNRTSTPELRTLNQLHEDNRRFCDAGNKLKEVKHYNNVKSKPIINIPLEQVIMITKYILIILIMELIMYVHTYIVQASIGGILEELTVFYLTLLLYKAPSRL